MPRPIAIVPILAVLFLSGCDGMTGDAETVPLAGTLWQVEDVDEGGIIDGSHITIEFPDEGRIGGSTGCNRYFGALTLDGGNFAVSEAGSTRRACVPAIMQQEQRVLTALREARTYAVEDDQWLLLYDSEGNRRIKAILIEEESATDGMPGDDYHGGD